MYVSLSDISASRFCSNKEVCSDGNNTLSSSICNARLLNKASSEKVIESRVSERARILDK
jgi:hypothetical protein